MRRSSLNRSAIRVRNKNYKSDVEYAFKLNRLLLKAIGIWPVNSSSSEFEKLISIISPIICCFLLIFQLIASFVELFVDLNTLEEKLNWVGPNSFCIMVLIKYYLLLVRGEKIKTCIDTVVNDWCEVNVKKERDIMMRHARIARGLTIVCAILMFSGGIFYATFVPLLATIALLRDNVTYRILPFNGNFIFFDAHAPPYYHVVFFLQVIHLVIMCSVSSGVCSLAAKFIMHICGQCQIIMYLLENLVDGGDNFSATLESRVAAVIVRHLRMLKFMSRVEELLNEMCLVEFSGCTLSMCVLGYYCITEWESANTLRLITFCLLLISITFNIFIFCYIGELLTNHCQEIGKASYMIDWYRIPGIQARFLVLLITIGNRPAKLTAGKMVHLSVASFSNVVRTSVAYLNILRTTASS